MAEFKTVMTVREAVVGQVAYRLTTNADGDTTISRTPFHDGRFRWSHSVLSQTLRQDGNFAPNTKSSRVMVMSLDDAMSFIEGLSVSA